MSSDADICIRCAYRILSQATVAISAYDEAKAIETCKSLAVTAQNCFAHHEHIANLFSQDLIWLKNPTGKDKTIAQRLVSAWEIRLLPWLQRADIARCFGQEVLDPIQFDLELAEQPNRDTPATVFAVHVSQTLALEPHQSTAAIPTTVD